MHPPSRVVNDGLVDLQGSWKVDALEFDQNGEINGAGGLLQIEDAPVTSADGASYQGDGRVRLLTGVDARVAGTETIGAGFHVELGGRDGSTMGGVATFAGGGVFDWTGGTLEAGLTLAHSMSMHVYGVNNGNGKRVLSGIDFHASKSKHVQLVDHGSITVDKGADFWTQQRADLVVDSDGNLSLAPGAKVAAMGCCISPDAIDNAGGLVTVPAGSGADGPATLSGVAYRVVAGMTEVAADSELMLAGGPKSSMTDTTVGGDGVLTVNDPTSVSGTITLADAGSLRLAQSRGGVDGTASVVGTGTFDWTGGALSGQLTFTNGGGVVLEGPAAKMIALHGSKSSSVTVDAAATFEAGTSKHHNTLEVDGSTMTLAGNTAMDFSEVDGGLLVNAGEPAIDPGPAGEVVGDATSQIDNQGALVIASGQLTTEGSYLQTAGSTSVQEGAALRIAGGRLNLTGGILTGSGTVQGSVFNRGGVVDPGTSTGRGPIGTLVVRGNYIQQSGGRLVIDLDENGSDMLEVQHAVTLAGALETHNLDGYTPNLGDTATIVTATGRLRAHLDCFTTTGQGSDTGHWEPVASAHTLEVLWKSGAAGGC